MWFPEKKHSILHFGMQELKGRLLDMLGSERITDLIPCHSDGLQHVRLVSDWNAEHNESHCKHAGGLWIGRSRFQKPRSTSSPRHRQPTLPDHVNGADFTIAHEQGGVDPRAGCIADSHPPEVDSPRAQADGDRAPPAEDGEEETAIKGLGRMTLDELKAKCTEHSLRVPTKATRGLLIKMLRHASQPSGVQVMNFGKYKSWMYKEVPVDYLRWAVWESEANDTAGDDLCHFAAWA